MTLSPINQICKVQMLVTKGLDNQRVACSKMGGSAQKPSLTLRNALAELFD